MGSALVATAILSLYLVAWGLFNQRNWAWFGGVVCFACMAANFALAFLCAGSTEYFRYLGVTDLDGSLIELQFPSSLIAMLLVLPTVCALLTMLFNSKHFDQTATKGELIVGAMALVMLTLLWLVV